MTYQNDELTMIAAQYQADNGMTDEEMADKLNIDPIRYKNFATASGDGWSFCEACALAEVTGCSLDKVAGIGLAHSEYREQFNEMEYTINHGRDVMTLCSETLLNLAMKLTPSRMPEQKELNVLFGLHDVCGLEAEHFDRILDNA